jgi:hypothetical protein
MIGLLHSFFSLLASPFKSKSQLEAENAALRHQLIALRRRVQGRVRLTNNDRWFFIQLYRDDVRLAKFVNRQQLARAGDPRFSIQIRRRSVR